jgi:hypothetical protein
VARFRFDQFAKTLLDVALSDVGEVRTQEEIHGEVQAADVLFAPAPGRAAERARLGLLGRMVETACLLEPFHHTPGADAALDCLTKQLTLRRNLVREARKDERGRPEIPRLWILSPGRPGRVLAGLGFRPLAGWPAGVWQAPSLLSTYLVVLRDLPETRDTLPLRLLGAGAAHVRAVAELKALTREDWEQTAFIPLLLAFRIEQPQDLGELDEETMRYAEQLKAVYAEWEREAIARGMEQGMKKGREELRNVFVDLYQDRFGSLPAELLAALEAMEDSTTLRGWIGLVPKTSAGEIAAAVLGARASREPAGAP